MRRIFLLAIAVAAPLPWGQSAAAQTATPPLAARHAEAVRAAVSHARHAVVQLQPIGGGGALSGDSPTGALTGLVISAGGEIITSSYAMDPAPSSILVTYDDGKRTTARVVALDNNRRLALLQAKRPPSRPPEIEPAADPLVGQTAIALGRSYRADEPNLAVGIVSATGRLYGRAVQTDAAVSPANYGGPLIDLRGRVLGVLTPLSPGDGDAEAGVGWYDSGIGFAVPLDQVYDRLNRLRAGENLSRGLAGVAFAQESAHATPPKLLAVHPGGPADLAGLRPGDLLTSAAGRPLGSVTDFRFAAHALDAGETLTVEASRPAEDGADSNETLSASITLVAELEPYRHPYFGIIARGGGGDPGLLINEVLPESPAAEAGLLAGDRITSVGGTAVGSRAGLASLLAGKRIGQELAVDLLRDGETLGVKIQLAPASHSDPAEPPPASPTVSEELIAPGSPRVCELITLQDKSTRRPVLIWLGGDWPQEGGPLPEAIAPSGCLLARPAAEENTTPEAESAYLNSLLTLLSSRPDVDPRRIVLGGSGPSGLMAARLALVGETRLVAGVVVTDWPATRGRLPDNRPAKRIAIMVLGADRAGRRLGDTLKAHGFPVFGNAATTDFAGWAAGLDRL